MSVRPLTVSEENKGYAHPWINIFCIFGASQGAIMYLHRHRIPFQSNWFAAPGSPAGLVLMTLGGFLVGGGIAMAAFTDWHLVRLAQQHKKDAMVIADGQSIKSFQ